jgi:hypothetical protein
MKFFWRILRSLICITAIATNVFGAIGAESSGAPADLPRDYVECDEVISEANLKVLVQPELLPQFRNGRAEIRGREIHVDGTKGEWSEWGDQFDYHMVAGGSAIDKSDLFQRGFAEIEIRGVPGLGLDLLTMLGPRGARFPADRWSKQTDGSYITSFTFSMWQHIGSGAKRTEGWDCGARMFFEYELLFNQCDSAECFGPLITYDDLFSQSDPQTLARLEYFIDADPGLGRGVALQFPEGASIVDLQSQIDLTNLETGPHTIYVRALDADGEWSHAESMPFYVVEQFPEEKAPVLQRMEYFVGDDPGMGEGLALSLEGDLTDVDLDVSVQDGTQVEGPLQVGVRVMDSYGRWSHTEFMPYRVYDPYTLDHVQWRVMQNGRELASQVVPAREWRGDLMEHHLADLGDVLETEPLEVYAAAYTSDGIGAPEVSRLVDIVSDPLQFSLSGNIDLNRGNGGEVTVQVTQGDRVIAQTSVDTEGGFQFDQVESGVGYELMAFEDTNGNGLRDASEASGGIPVDSLGLFENLEGLNFALEPGEQPDFNTHHPADLNLDLRIQLDEVTAYGAAWKRGTTWPFEPNPIPIDYLTRAGALWRNGERYAFDANAASAPLWWVNQNAGVQPLTEIPLRSDYERWVTRSLLVEDIPGQVPEIAWGSTGIQVHPIPGTQAWAMEWTSSESEVDDQRWGPFFGDLPGTLQPVEPHPEMDGSLFRMSMDGRSMFYGAVSDVVDPGLEFTLDGSVIVLIPRGVQGWFVMETSLNLTDWHALKITELRAGRVYAVRQDESRFYRIRSVNNVF